MATPKKKTKKKRTGMTRTATVKAKAKPAGEFSAKGKAFADSIKAGQATVPGFMVVPDLRPYSALYAIATNYLEAASTAYDSSAKLQAVCDDFDPELVRDAIRFDAAYDRPQTEAQRLAAGIEGARVLRYVAAVQMADALYGVAQGIAKQKGEDTLRTNVAKMGKTRRMKRKTKEGASKRGKRASKKTAPKKAAAPAVPGGVAPGGAPLATSTEPKVSAMTPAEVFITPKSKL